jgi:hypothetical protein
LYDAQKELEFSEEKHNITIEKYKKDLDDMKNLHAEKELILEQQLKDAKEKYLRDLENVCRFLSEFYLIVSNIYIFI